MNEQIREGFVDATPVAAPEPVREEVATVKEERRFDTWPVIVKLRKPINSGDGRGTMLNELTFREPTGRDINNCGNPVRIDSDGEIQVDEKKMTQIMAHLSGVLPPLIQGMHPIDWNSCYYRLRPFFLPDPRSW